MVRWFSAAACVVLFLASCDDTSDGSTDVHVEPAASLALDLETGDYGSVTVGSRSTLSFFVSNVGDAATGPLTTALTGDGFIVQRNDCGALRAGAACRIVVALAPTTPGAKTGSLVVSADPGGSVSAALDGEGVSPGALSIATSTSDLGTVAVGSVGTTVATFTVTNSGDTATGPLAVKAAGAAPGHFDKRSDTCDDAVLAPAASCTFEVAFAPYDAGDKSAAFVVRAHPGGEVSAAVAGVARNPAALTIAPTRHTFGRVALGATSEPLDVVVTNRGGMPTGPLNVALVGAGFSASGCAGGLEGGQTCSVQVVFAPEVLGDASATLTVSGPNTVSAALTGEGVATQLRISPSASIVDPTVIGASSVTHHFSVTNIAPRDSGPLAITFDDVVGGPFVRVPQPDDCAASLAPRATCSIGVALSPSAAGPASATLVVTSPGSGTVSADLSGSGLTPAALVLAPEQKDFGAVPVGRDAAQAFTVTNTGGERSGRITVALAGPDVAHFRIASNPCVRLGPGRSCTLLVRFRPGVIAVANATLTISAEPGGTQVAALTGEGVDPQQLTISPTTSTFAPTALGERDVQTFIVTADSKAATGRVAVDVEGRLAGDYEVDHDCAVLAPQGTCTITVAFAPRSLGVRNARLVVSANPGGIVAVDLAGIGRPRVEVVDGQGDAIATTDFGDAVVGTTAPTTREVLVRNNSADTVPLTISPSFGSPAQFALVSTCETIAPGATCAVQLAFAPTVLGVRTGRVTFGIGSGRFDRVTQALVGRGIDALVIAPETTAAFGDVPLNTSARRAFVVTNAVDGPTSGPLVVRVSGNGYRVSNDACATTRLAAGESCRVEVTFAPPTKGALGGSLSATATPGGAPRLALTATGVDPIGAAATTITLTPSNLLENAPAGTLVGTLGNDDSDVGDSYSYTLVSGTGSSGNAAFRIEGDTIVSATPFDREATPTQSIRVRVVDSGGQVLVQVVTVTIDNVDEPAVLADDLVTIDEDTGPSRIDVLANDVDPDTTLVIGTVTQAAHGTVTVTDGAVTYTPAANYCATTPDVFTYTAGGATANVAVTVTCVDDPTTPVNDTAATTQGDPAKVIDVLANDTDPDGNKRIVAVTQPAEGSVAIIEDGARLTYQASANPTLSTVTFTYQVVGGASGTVTVNVTILDDAPVAVADAATVAEDAAATPIAVLANDTDTDGGPMVVQAVTQPANGTVTLAAGVVSYRPNTNYANTPPGTTLDTFTYTLNGGSIGTVTVTVTAADDPAVAVADAATVAEDAAATAIAVLANDTDVDGGPVSIQSVTQPANGVVVVTGGGSGLTYQPNANYANTPPGTTLDTFTYTLTPGGSIATVSVSVTAVDDAPVAVADAFNVFEDSVAVPIDLTANDTDIDGGPRRIQSVTQPSAGVVVIVNNGASITFTPNANFQSTSPAAEPMTFTYTLEGGSTASVSATVIAVDDAPVAVDDAATVAANSPAAAVVVLGNDSDIDGGPKTIDAVTQPANGTVVRAPDGTGLTFAPAADFLGQTSFTYTLNGGSSATVTMTVVDVPAVAANDSATINEDSGANAVAVLANDTAGSGGLTIEAVTQPANGIVAITSGGSGLTYTPSPNYENTRLAAAPDVFTYTLGGGSVGTVSVTVTNVDDAAVAVADAATVTEDSGANAIGVLANDTDIDAGPIAIQSVTQPANGTVVITGGGTGLTYAPNANYANNPPGTFDTFTYTLTPGGSATTVAVTVNAVDDSPVAVTDSASVTEDSGANAIDVLANDSDVDGGAKSIQSVTQPANGTVVVTGGGTGLTYAPNANYANTPPGTFDTFTYTLTPGGSTTTVAVTVNAVDDLPEAIDDSATIGQDAAATAIDVLANDTDIDAGTKLVASVTQPANGGVVITGGGTGLTYQPNPGYINDPPTVPADVFTYTLTPGGATATVRVTVNNVDDPPLAVADAATVAEDAAATAIDVLANDTDVDAGPIAIQSVTQPANGTVVITGGGTGLTYAPNPNYANTPPGTFDTFTYTLTPGGSATTVAVTVNAIDDSPVAVADAATVTEDSGANAIDVLANDSDVDAGPKSIQSVTQPANGTVVITGGGTALTYAPNPNYANHPPGTFDTFTYTLSPGGSSTTVAVAVNAVNDPPVITGTTSFSIAENTTAVTTFGVTDPDGPSAIWSLTGPDAASFTIVGGVLAFASVPDFEARADVTGDNVYELTVNVSDGLASATLPITVTLTNVPESGVIIDIFRADFPSPLPLTGMIHVFDEESSGDVTVTLDVVGELTIQLGSYTGLVTVERPADTTLVILTGLIDDVSGVLDGLQGASVSFTGDATEMLTVTLVGSTTASDRGIVAGPYITVPYVMVVSPGETRAMNAVIYDRLGAPVPGIPTFVVAAPAVATVTDGILTAGLTDNATTEITATSNGIVATYTTALAVRTIMLAANGMVLPSSITASDNFSAFGNPSGRPTTSYYADLYAIDLLAGQTITVTMDTGDDLDSYLLLAQGAVGFLVAGNDDDDEGILGVGSRMIYTATESGRYYIEASTFNGLDTGAYTLGVTVN